MFRRLKRQKLRQIRLRDDEVHNSLIIVLMS